MTSRGGPEVLRYGEIAPPLLEAGQVRVAVKAVALNHLDVWVRKGIASPKLPCPISSGVTSPVWWSRLGQVSAGSPLGMRWL